MFFNNMYFVPTLEQPYFRFNLLAIIFQGNKNMSFEQGLIVLQNQFRDYITSKVLSKIKIDKFGETTFRTFHFEDFETLF